MKRFGEWGGAVMERTAELVPAPVGELCLLCGEPIREGDSGIILPHFAEGERWKEAPNHRRCFIESVFGEERANLILEGEKHGYNDGSTGSKSEPG